MHTHIIRQFGILHSLEIIEYVLYMFAGTGYVHYRTCKAKTADFTVFIICESHLLHLCFLRVIKAPHVPRHPRRCRPPAGNIMAALYHKL